MNKTNPLARQILELVRSENYRPAKPKQLASQLNLPEDRLYELKKTIKQLIKSGQLSWGPKHLVFKGVERRASDEVTGRFQRAAAGYGFVKPDADDGSELKQDIFIPLRKTLDAANGDRVRVKLSKRPARNQNRVSGGILEVIERRSHQFVGTYADRGDRSFVQVDGGVFDSVIYVGDASAKNGRDGDKVVIEMVKFPSPTRDGSAVIVEVLGDRGTPGVDTLSVIRQFGLPEDFPDAVTEQARELAEKFDNAPEKNRVDLTHLTVVTIDPAEARDFDDAISLEQIENDHWRLGVHIADVSHFVQPNTPLDNEALARATSIYLPDRVIPMLPETISNHLASLQPDQPRYTMTAFIEYTAAGLPIGAEFCRGIINSAHRFNYEEVDDYLADDSKWKKKLTPEVFRLVRDMHSLAMKLRQRRMKRGSLNLILPEIKILLDEDGRVCGARAVENTESHQVIEEFMLAANEAVAAHINDLELPYLRRIHESPSNSKLKTLAEFLSALGLKSGSLHDRFAIKEVLRESEDRPDRIAIHFAVLRSMQKAIYGPQNSGHFALASENYCHFTSPIRRYPDLVIHRIIGSLIDGRKPGMEFSRLRKLGEHCSELEQRAEMAERDLTRLKLLNFLVDKVGMELDAVITGVESYGVFAQGREMPVEGLIPIENLPPDNYEYDKGARSLIGKKPRNIFRLGDGIRIRIGVVDPDRRELELELAGADQKHAKDSQKSTSGNKQSGSKRVPGGANRSQSKTGKQKHASGKRDNSNSVEPKSGTRRRKHK